MKRYWFGFLFFSNLMFLFVNLWKISYTFNPGPLVAIGALVAFANFATSMALFIKAHRHHKFVKSHGAE